MTKTTKTTVQIDKKLMQQVKMLAIEYDMAYSAVVEILVSEAFKDDTMRSTINLYLEHLPAMYEDIALTPARRRSPNSE
jgi:hypothetical protein